MKRLLLTTLVTICLVARPANAQVTSPDYWIVGGGPAYQPDPQAGHARHLSASGLHVQAAAGWSLQPQWGAEFEALWAHFEKDVDHIHSPCRPDEGPFACHEPVGPVGIAGLTASVGWRLTEYPRSARIALGVGAYRAVEHPTEEARHAMGATAALRIPLWSARPRAALQVAFHRFMTGGLGPKWIAPLALQAEF